MADKRLVKHLWIEFILNSEAVKIAADTDIRDALTEVLSWYLVFRWLLPENAALLEIKYGKFLLPHPVSLNVYQKHKRSFLKEILHAGLI